MTAGLGSLAWQVAEKIQGITIVSKATYNARIISAPKVVIDNYAYHCERIFGSFTRDACFLTAKVLACSLKDKVGTSCAFRL